MKALKNIIQTITIEETIGPIDVQVEAIQFDSRLVTPNSIFVATPGTKTDGHSFIPKAIELGANVIVCEAMPTQTKPTVTYIRVKDSTEALAYMASAFFGNPSSKLRLIGVTGTNGKTTTATLLYNMFREMGHKAGLLSTVVYRVNDEVIEATHTTPDTLQINRLMQRMVDEGCEYCFMEVSSHSVVQKRVCGLNFAGGIFSNITHDHLDYHKTFAEYIKAKKGFFDVLGKDAFALINNDDKNGNVMLQNTAARKFRYALKSDADFRCKIIESHFGGMQLKIDNNEVWTHFIGEFNAYNLLSVYAAAVLLGKPAEQVLTCLSQLHPVSGRFECVRSSDGITAIVDYAHTPDALINVLSTINQIRTGKEQVITITGAGGDRDKTKRPIMAKVCAELSDKVILTSDNPRTEDPLAILHDMESGIEAKYSRKVTTIADRREAIKTACFMAKPGDIILIAGKGHENYQDVNGVKHHFDDKEEVARFLIKTA